MALDIKHHFITDKAKNYFDIQVKLKNIFLIIKRKNCLLKLSNEMVTYFLNSNEGLFLFHIDDKCNTVF